MLTWVSQVGSITFPVSPVHGWFPPCQVDLVHLAGTRLRARRWRWRRRPPQGGLRALCSYVWDTSKLNDQIKKSHTCKFVRTESTLNGGFYIRKTESGWLEMICGAGEMLSMKISWARYRVNIQDCVFVASLNDFTLVPYHCIISSSYHHTCTHGYKCCKCYFIALDSPIIITSLPVKQSTSQLSI